jgi:hypothetical protein
MKKLVLFSIIFLYQLSSSQWQECNNGLTNKTVYSLGVLNGKIFAGTFNGIFVSSDDGESWVLCNNGISYNDTTKANRVTFIKVIGNKIFAGVEGTLYLSEDSGETWVNKFNKLADNQYQLSMDIANEKLFLGVYGAGMYCSENYGNNWVLKNNGLTEKWILSVAAQGNKIFCGTGGSGIFLSENNGDSWVNVLNQTGSIVTLLTVDYGIFAGNGAHFSSNGGKKWYRKYEGLPSGLNSGVYSFICDGNYVFAGTKIGVYVSDDKGDFWERKSVGIPMLGFGDINTIYAFAIKGDDIYAGSSCGGMYKAKLKDVENIGLDTIRLTIKDQMTSEPIKWAKVILRYDEKDCNLCKYIIDTTDVDGQVVFYPNFDQGRFEISITLKGYQTYIENFSTYNELKYRKEIFIGTYPDIPSYINTLNKNFNDIALTSGPITVYADDKWKSRTGIIYPDYFFGISMAKMFYKWKGDPMALVLPVRDYYSFNLVPTGDGDYTFEIWKNLKGNSYKYLKYEGKVINNIITKIPGKIESVDLQTCWIELNSDSTKNDYNLYIDLTGDNIPEDTLHPIINITTGVDEFDFNNDNKSFTIFPNPSNDFITLSSENNLPLCEIEIYNLLGEIVFKSEYIGLTAEINISDLPLGEYIIRRGISYNIFIRGK